jgi:hypothetical protein
MVSMTGNEVLEGEVGLEGDSSGDWLSVQAARATAARAAHRRGKRGKGISELERNTALRHIGWRAPKGFAPTGRRCQVGSPSKRSCPDL